MSTTYTPTADWPTGYTIPDDGDGPVKAADVNTGLEALGDRTEELHENIYDRWYPCPSAVLVNENARFTESAGDGWTQNSVVDVGKLVCDAPLLPPNGTVTNIRFFANAGGAGGHGGSLPATMPIVELEYADSTGAQGEILSTTDDSASAAAYDAQHTVTGAGIAAGVALTDGQRFFAQIFGETGANSVAGALRIWLVEIYVERAP